MADTALALPVEGDALWRDLMALAEITDPALPYTRRSFSPLFLKGRDWLAERFRRSGLAPSIDAAGNLIGRREGSDPSAGTIMVGSHSDTVPGGGRFDGIAGVVAGLAVADALARRGAGLRHALEVVDFLAEEPSEYGISCIGSRGISGKLSSEHLALANPAGETVEAAMLRIGGRPSERSVRKDIRAAFELHIEQGPVLEADRIDLGLVTSIVGITRLEIAFEGAADHAGTAPMDRRHDALVAAARTIGWIRDEASRCARLGRGYFVATVGIVSAEPNAANVVPKSARIVVDARSEDRVLMEDFCAALEAEAGTAARAADVSLARFRRLSDGLPAACDPALRRLLAAGASRLGLSAIDMASGAGHDMAFVSLIAPVAMVFVACRDGRSHTPEEWAEPDALAKGAAAIYEAVAAFDRA